MTQASATSEPVDPYFLLTEKWNAKFWSRFGGIPNVAGKVCMDLGAGVGSLSAELARHGAVVFALEPDPTRVERAKVTIAQLYGDALAKINFVTDILPNCGFRDKFDFIFSRDTFEHIKELEKTVAAARESLKPGGRVYAGFGPLYNSPFGDHGILRSPVPWTHVLLRRQVDAERTSIVSREKIAFLKQELNMLPLRRYEEILRNCGLTILDWRYNVSRHPAMKIFSLMRAVTPLREYFTASIYVILEKR